MLELDKLMTTATAEATSTEFLRLEPGEYEAQVADLKFDSFTYKMEERAGETGYKLVVNWVITNKPELAEAWGGQPRVKQDFIIDLNKSGALSHGKGKNVTLGYLREAAGQNKNGQEWAPSMLKGAFAVIDVDEEIVKDRVYNRVKAVRAA